MNYETLLTEEGNGVITITFNRLTRRNSINESMLRELNEVLDYAERQPSCRVIVLQGQKGIFCTGMDFQEVSSGEWSNDDQGDKRFTHRYISTLKRFSLIPKVVIAKVNGQVMAGGVGFVAASDLAIAGPEAQFSLSEALWGLLPSMVLPYLIRRVGFQKAYSMTLTTLPVSASEAVAIHLVDEVSENLEESIRHLSTRLIRLEEQTLHNMKQYFRKMWIITDEIEQTAAAETARLVTSPQVKRNIENYVNHRLFPWETRKT